MLIEIDGKWYLIIKDQYFTAEELISVCEEIGILEQDKNGDT